MKHNEKLIWVILGIVLVIGIIGMSIIFSSPEIKTNILNQIGEVKDYLLEESIALQSAEVGTIESDSSNSSITDASTQIYVNITNNSSGSDGWKYIIINKQTQERKEYGATSANSYLFNELEPNTTYSIYVSFLDKGWRTEIGVSNTIEVTTEESYEAEIIVEGGVELEESRKYVTLEEAIESADIDTLTEIKLLKNIERNESIEISEKNVSIDLNGKQIEYTGTGDAISVSQSYLTIEDLSQEQTGIIKSTNGTAIYTIGGVNDTVYNTTVTINGGTIEGKIGVSVSISGVYIYGGTIRATEIGIANGDYGEVVIDELREVNIEGAVGIENGNEYASANVLDIGGGRIFGTYSGIENNNSELIINGGIITSSEDGVFITRSRFKS